MADTAFQTQFRQETVQTFEVRESLVRQAVTHEAVIKGNTATFLVAGSGGAEAVTRGVNGLIPARANDLTQTSATLVEWHDLARVTDFNVFASQGDQREIMQIETVGVINRKIDSDIITQLNTGTQDTGAATTASLNLVVRSKVILGNADVPNDGMISALVTPAFMGYLSMTPEFASGDYVDLKPLVGSDFSYAGRPKAYRWQNINWIEHPNLPGVGTSAEKCFMFHKRAIGHAFDKRNVQIDTDFDREQAYSWARCSAYMGSLVLQNSGIVVMNHDGSGFAAE